MDSRMKEILTDEQFERFAQAYRNDYARAQQHLNRARSEREHADQKTKSWSEEINRLKAAAYMHGFDITKEKEKPDGV